MVGAVGVDIEKVDPALREATRKLPVPDASKAWMRGLIRLYRPDERIGDGALLWIHGGGLLFGDARQDEVLCAETAHELGIPVVSANYRFAPDHPFPAPLDDVRAAWAWLQAHAAELGVDPARIVVGGESAGAGLAASLVQRVHDEGGTQPLAQWLFAPMIDDRTAADESLDAIEHWVWNNRANRFGWSGYLGTAFGQAEAPAYAAAARRVELSGLPRTYIAVGDIELFYAEDVDYARRLERAGAEVVLDVVPGAPHGFENWARDTEPAKALLLRARAWLRDALG
ncbi:MAG TPA: alpha/beta hydrolase [Lacisediminihabitans sp.]|uniref:alpha/beta hydrolase n=1 Tax=Lacisediminihabitans sp. TaxID=2787631 RepID=UPI002ED83527